jgi:hypothetical protein
VEGTFGSAEGEPSGPPERKRSAGRLRVHVRSSANGFAYDTADLATFDLAPDAGDVCRQSFELDCAARFVKLMVENLDADRPVRDVKVTATLMG